MMRSIRQRVRHACTVTLLFGLMAEGVMGGVRCASAQTQADKLVDDTAKTEHGAAESPAVDPRRAKLIADTRRMLALSHEVQVAMAKNGPDTLSLGVVKKVEELQKLAALVKAEMAKTP